MEMVAHIDNKVRKAIKVIATQNAKLVSLICDKVTSMDSASWASVHGYIV